MGKNLSQQRLDTYFPNKTFSLHQANLSHCSPSSLCSILLQIFCCFCSLWSITDLDCPPLSFEPTHSLHVSGGSIQVLPSLWSLPQPLQPQCILCPLMICYIFYTSSPTTLYCQLSVSSPALLSLPCSKSILPTTCWNSSELWFAGTSTQHAQNNNSSSSVPITHPTHTYTHTSSYLPYRLY